MYIEKELGVGIWCESHWDTAKENYIGSINILVKVEAYRGDNTNEVASMMAVKAILDPKVWLMLLLILHKK